ncbi:MAG: imidazole glycerol phosphate synthase subunit HisH [Thermodesulfovibrionales bacterium]|nr:imidazole glycerol phosphate synthase subunit HisH [Thermodesulfovibrionales bacterium]
MIAIIDYEAGNLTSVEQAVKKLGFRCRITQKAEELLEAESIIFPGVGAAGRAMASLKRLGLDDALKRAFYTGKPILGICLGAQIVLERSEEDETQCLGLIPGTVRRFPHPLLSPDGKKLKIPHMGWNTVTFTKRHPVIDGVPDNNEFYFVHTYYPAPASEEYVLGKTEYGIAFASVIARKNFVASQFHSEKSGKPGLKILKNFCEWAFR